MGIAERLMEARKELGLTRRAVGERAGVDLNMIYEYETGRRNPSTLALRGLASLYNKPVEWFWKEEAESEQSDDNVLLGERLREARRDRRMTLDMVANALNSSSPVISRYEGGQQRPSEPILHALANIYGRSVEWLLGEEDDEPELPPLTPEEIKANWELVMSEPNLALRATTAELTDDDIADIADYIRFVREREERRRRERQQGS